MPFWCRELLALFRFYRLRFTLSLLGIIIGIAAISALVTIQISITKNTQLWMEKIGKNRFGLSLKSPRALSLSHLNDFCDRFLPEYQLMPYQILGLSAVYAFHPLPAQVVLIKPDFFSSMQWSVKQGRALSTKDENQKVVVVGSKIAELIKSNVDNPYLSLHNMYFKIIGVIEVDTVNPLLDFDPNQSIFVDMRMLHRLPGSHAIESFLVEGLSQQNLKERLKTQFGISKVFIKDMNIFRDAIAKQVSRLLQVLAIIAAITLLLGAVSILNILLILMNERRKEMGVRLALGTTPSQICWQLLRESLTLCLIGGSSGIVFGQIGAYYIIVKGLDLLYFPAFLSWIFSIGISVLLGGLVGLLPALLLSKTSPVALLKS